MKKNLLLFLVIPFLSFSQSKFSITGSAGMFSMNEDFNLNWNASLNYIIKEDSFTQVLMFMEAKTR
jgi:hypothetical protein